MATFSTGAATAPISCRCAALECPVKRLRGEYRYQVFLKMYFKADTRRIAAQMQALAEKAEGARAELEVNPTSLL